MHAYAGRDEGKAKYNGCAFGEGVGRVDVDEAKGNKQHPDNRRAGKKLQMIEWPVTVSSVAMVPLEADMPPNRVH